MNSDLLVIFENEQVFPDALTYARELALRIDARVTLLMLVSMSFAGSGILGAKRSALKKIESRAGALLAKFSEPFIRERIEIASALKIGEPAQELIKYLADRPPFKAILWGSGQELPFVAKGGSGHWLRKVTASLECPLLTITRRTPPQ
ncbi:conserved hypothetical protein [Desulfamplus magnetovallimortis]|uniref:UspA domain-containing protein n=1 Tax=Desulfamplus magnetovallimortis TaxID=1246637 RepID=A0A1W1HJJ5_9BACT|nr:universal stress protein [Desulfamplus magnetovallimortis]SLM32542.1 conserved hypothetical protein [Desulfamplus magnetovallimortis]